MNISRASERIEIYGKYGIRKQLNKTENDFLLYKVFNYAFQIVSDVHISKCFQKTCDRKQNG